MIRQIVKTVAYKENPLVAVILKTETKKYDLCFFNDSKKVDVYSQLTNKELKNLLSCDEYIIREVNNRINIYFEEEVN